MTKSSSESDVSQATQVRRATRGRKILYVVAAFAIAIIIGCAYLSQDTLINTLFGPPAVEMTEAYESKPDGPAFDHGAFDTLLRKYVNENGGVDYAGLQEDREQLRAYIQQIGQADVDSLGRNQKLTLLINAYNAFTLELILDHWDSGQLKSIRDIPSAQRWDAVRWKVGSNTWSLNQIEHEQIRPKFVEPRIHFALVCAAVGCPPLRSEAYVAERLDAQLHEQAAYVHTHDLWMRLAASGRVVHLTQLYNWYGGDFKQSAGSVLAYVGQYVPQVKQAIDAGDSMSIQWLDYDWSLNSQQNIP